MDKQMIEEMVKIVDRVFSSNYCGDYKSGIKDFAIRLIENGVVKIPENAVVLTEKDLKEKIDCCDVSMIHHDDDGKRYIEYERYEDFTDRLGKRIQQLKGKLKQERKETAEKFYKKLKERFVNTAYWMFLRRDFDEICKEITGEE